MMHLLQYILPFIISVALTSSSDINDIATEQPFQTTISADRPEFCPPRQTDFANTQQVRTTVQRTNGWHRSFPEFIKAGKTLSNTLQLFILKKSETSYFNRIKPVSRLHFLGILII